MLLFLTLLLSAGPLSPADSIATMRLPAGLSIQCVAAEPLVIDPVAISFDHRGRLYAAEYRDYPRGPAVEGQPPLSRVRLMEDTNDDGVMDVSHIFADQLPFAQGVLAYNDGVIVTAAPDILFLKDTNGDNKADVREVLYTGFKPGNPQLRVSHPQWGPDNWIYLANGLSGGSVSSPTNKEKPIALTRVDFRFNPRTGAFEPATGFGQFGNTFDDWGHRFGCSNRNPVIASIIPHHAVARNPLVRLDDAFEDAAPFGGDAKVYPRAATQTTAHFHTGTFTAACGVGVYRGDWLGPDFADNVFTCDPTGYLVVRYYLKPKGVSFVAERDRPNEDFLTATDTWFRPVSVANGPDGALYVCDMYRAVIEHPDFMPKGLPETLDLRAGDDRGRIYRIKPDGKSARPFASPKTTADLVALLNDSNGWRRQLGQRLLVERQAKDAVPELEKLANSNNPLARLHALWTLNGLESLTPAVLLNALSDADSRIQENAVALSAPFAASNPAIETALIRLTSSPSDRVRFQAALALGECGNERELGECRNDQRLGALAKELGANLNDRWICDAVLTSIGDQGIKVLENLLADPALQSANEQRRTEIVIRLAAMVGVKGDVAELAQVFEWIANAKPAGSWRQSAMITGLADGLTRSTGKLGRTSLAKVLSKPPAELATQSRAVEELLKSAASRASDASIAIGDRTAAIKLLGYLPYDQAAPALPGLLSAQQPIGVQTAAIETLRKLNDDRMAPMLFENWTKLGPGVQAIAVDILLRRPRTRDITLQAMKRGELPSSMVSADLRYSFTASKDPKLAELGKAVFGAASPDRQKVIEQYKEALAAAGDITAGKAVFKKTCSTCHKIDGEGFVVGPDISDVRNKTPETLLSDILDPNKAVDPRFTNYLVSTHEGQVLSGLLVGENSDSITLRRAEQKEDVVLRSDIAEMQATGKSVMPEGLEKDLSVAQVRDLLSFLKAKEPSK